MAEVGVLTPSLAGLSLVPKKSLDNRAGNADTRPNSQYLLSIYFRGFISINRSPRVRLFMTQKMKLIAGGVLLASAAVFSGCGDSVPSNANALYHENNRSYNALGLVASAPASYERVSPNTISIRPGQDYVHRDISGDNTTVLWGLMTFADY